MTKQYIHAHGNTSQFQRTNKTQICFRKKELTN